MQRILIIGAGIAATAIVTELVKNISASSKTTPVEITLAEKSRGFGGRMATRRSAPFEFDHGAQFFTARSTAFQQFVDKGIENGSIVEWQARVATFEPGNELDPQIWPEPHYVATPTMSSLCKHTLNTLAEQGIINLLLQTEVTELCRLTSAEGDYWKAMSGHNPIGDFDLVISTAPSQQTEALFANANFSDMPSLLSTSHLPCFSLMIGLERAPSLNFDFALVKDSPISIIVQNSSKPRRDDSASLLIHSDNRWARNHWDESTTAIQETLLIELQRIISIKQEDIAHIDFHRWRYAKTDSSAGKDFLFDRRLQLAACGDWCLGGRIEDAFLSGTRLGKALSTYIAG